MATKIESTEITHPKKVFVKSEQALDEMEANGQLEPFTDYYTDDEESDEFKAIEFAESERLKSLNLFDKDVASKSHSYIGNWGLSLYDLVPEKALGNTITITFPEVMNIIRFTTSTETGSLATEALNSNYIVLPMDSEWWINNRSGIFMYIQKSNGAWITPFDGIVAFDIMVTYGSEPQAYQPYFGDVIHKTDLSLLNSDARLGKNLFDFDSFIVPTVFQNPSNGTVTTDFTNKSITMTASSNDQYVNLVNGVQLKPNTLYSFGFEFSPANNIEIYIHTPEYGWVGTDKNHYTFITGASGLVNHFRVDNNTAGATTTFSKLMLNEGDVLLPYEEFKGRVLCEKDDIRYIGVPTETTLDISLSSSDFVWTAPHNGYIVVGCQGAADGSLGYFRIWNIGQTLDPTVDINVLYAINASAVYSYHTAHNVISATCAVRKGDRVRIIYSNVQNPSARFVYGGAVL